jgi:hypothetical protein
VAERNYLVDGVSGAGKSSVYEELVRRGYTAVSTDRAWKFDTDVWDREKAVRELERPEPDVLFVCGSSGNRDLLLPHFAKVFNLRIDDDTMIRRLQERTNNDFGKRPEELELMLRLNRSGAGPAGAVDLDATRPLGQVVDELLRLADCEPARSDSRPWSRRRAATGQSFALSESALPLVQAAAGEGAAFSEALDREAITRIEYIWSGDVLTTLLSYLDEEGIDLRHSEHERVASTIAHARGGSVVVFTSAHRARYESRLDPSAFDGAVLRRYYEAFNDVTADGVGYAMLDGVAFFRDALAPLESASVALCIIESQRKES